MPQQHPRSPRPVGRAMAASAGVLAALVGAGVGAPPPAQAQPIHATAATTAPGGSSTAEAYTVLTQSGQLIGYGGAFSGSVPAPTSPVVAVASTPDGHGAYAAEANGGVVALGDAVFRGSMAGVALAKPIVGIAVDPSTGGYWLVASDGGIFSFGGATFYGSTGGLPLVKPIVGMSAMPDGRGYRLVASDGGIFTFGDAPFLGSTGGVALNRPVVGMASTPSGNGYWLVASDGGVFSFGDAGFFGSTGNVVLARPIIAIDASPTGLGYWMVASDGGIFNFGDAHFYGSAAGLGQTVVGMAEGLPGNYGNPLRGVTGLTPMRVDEGVDFGGSGPIYAIGDGVVTSTTGPWPGGAFITYRLTDGPAAGKLVYVAENVTPSVSIGQTVTASTVVGILHDSFPYMETGWAADQWGDTVAAQSGQWTPADDAASLPSAYGVNFNQLLTSLGAPSGVLVQPTVVGTVSAGWPAW
ncbi:MAG: hypothetical protein KGQ66_23595 [Acidobacteriota bacterium]|nr:hypothetical protein [Acidobacteriota bacterium]